MNYSPVPMPPVADPNRQQNQFITPMPPTVQPTLSNNSTPGYLGPPVAQPINQDVAPIAPKFSAIPLNPPAPSQNQGLAQWMSNYMQHTGFHGPTGMPVFTHGGKHYIPQVAQGDPLTTNPDIGGTPMPPTAQQPFAYQTFQNSLNASGRGTPMIHTSHQDAVSLPTGGGPGGDIEPGVLPGTGPGPSPTPNPTIPPIAEPPNTFGGRYDGGETETGGPRTYGTNGDPIDENGTDWGNWQDLWQRPGNWADNPNYNPDTDSEPSSPNIAPRTISGPRTGGPTASGPGNISTTPGFLGSNQYYNWGTGHMYGLHNQGGFLRNFGGEQQIRDPNKFGYNGTGDAGRLINVNASHRDTDPAMRNYLRAWSAAHSSIFQPGMQRGG